VPIKENKMQTLHKPQWIKLLATIGAILTGAGVAISGSVYEGIGIALAAIAGPQTK